MSDLVELARRYVAASGELKSLRNEIRRAVLNGEGAAHSRVHHVPVSRIRCRSIRASRRCPAS